MNVANVKKWVEFLETEADETKHIRNMYFVVDSEKNIKEYCALGAVNAMENDISKFPAHFLEIEENAHEYQVLKRSVIGMNDVDRLSFKQIASNIRFNLKNEFNIEW